MSGSTSKRPGLLGAITDSGWQYVARPILFQMGNGDAETAHTNTVAALAWLAKKSWVRSTMCNLLQVADLPRTVFGVTFPNPIGLAAGADKDGAALAAWSSLGFGFIEGGTVTAHAQPGNSRPRVFRLPASQGVINRMGFPNAGAHAFAQRAAQTGPLDVPLGISLGKSKITPASNAVADYVTSLEAVEPYADYVAINVSSPNTPGLRGLQDRGALDELVTALVERARALAQKQALLQSRTQPQPQPQPQSEAQALENSAGRHGKPVPLLVKIAPDLTTDAISDVLQVCADRGVSGIIATNTTTSRDGILAGDAGLRSETGGLSGSPLRRRALEVVRFVCSETDLPVIGVGGITTAADGAAMLDAGASLLQIYTGMLYRGPGLVRDLVRAAAIKEAVQHAAQQATQHAAQHATDREI